MNSKIEAMINDLVSIRKAMRLETSYNTVLACAKIDSIRVRVYLDNNKSKLLISSDSTGSQIEFSKCKVLEPFIEDAIKVEIDATRKQASDELKAWALISSGVAP